jgi:hypothetical protein
MIGASQKTEAAGPWKVSLFGQAHDVRAMKSGPSSRFYFSRKLHLLNLASL